MIRALITLAVLLALPAWTAPTVPTEIEQPGTQPGEVTGFATNCDSCHGGTSNPIDEPSYGWHGSMMSHSARDPIFWATVAIAEQDFLPDPDPAQRGGAGDLCLRCHSPNGWLGQRSTPTDGSALTGADERGVECEFCHLMVDPDQPTSISGTTETQHAPYEAFDPATGEGYYGSGQYVINGNGTRLGPYADHEARHQALASPFMRQGEFCGTCHDVSNPAVGDLAHNNGAQQPLAPGTFSGVVGSAVDNKAAFNNQPYAYGIVERTFSEWKASAWDTYLVNDYPNLPADLRQPDGILDFAYHQAYDDRSDANYEDGTLRYYTCQTCHMSAATGVGCNKNNMPVRTDLPRHDLTGGQYYMPDVLLYQYDNGLLRFGGITQDQRDALATAKTRATERLQAAADLSASQQGGQLVVRVANLTGHKLISGYPEGRRMWLNIRWLDSGGGLVAEEGEYGPIGRTVIDLGDVPHQVESLIDPDDTVLFEAEMGLTKEWADQLLALGYDPNLPLSYDRMTDAVEHTLQYLANEPPGETEHSFHFVLNNAMIHDGRLPPYGFDYDEAKLRNALPVPESQFGNPGPGGTYDYWGEYPFTIPQGAATAEVRLYYQQTSWEYIQFLWLANDRQNTFLGDEGVNLLDAWLNTGQGSPLEMELASVAVTPPPSTTAGEASHQDLPAEQMRVTAFNRTTGEITIQYTPACDATDHAVYFGDLAQVSSYTYAGAECSAGTSGTFGFDPGLDAAFFVVVGHDGSLEGSYGADSSGVERPEETTGHCVLTRDLSGVVCE